MTGAGLFKLSTLQSASFVAMVLISSPSSVLQKIVIKPECFRIIFSVARCFTDPSGQQSVKFLSNSKPYVNKNKAITELCYGIAGFRINK